MHLRTLGRRLLDSRAVPDAWRRVLGKFYVLNVEHRRDLYHPATTPEHLRQSLYLLRTLNNDYGFVNSLLAQMCLDADGEPIPWYTYPAIEFLKQLDFSDKTVFEYGCGNSTLFWAKRAKRVVSVEHNRNWHAQISLAIPENCELVLEPNFVEYVKTLERYPEAFDIIVIDCPAYDKLKTIPMRLECAKVAHRKLKEGGFIILDNSDWLPLSAEFLRSCDLIEVDMAGFGPLNAVTETTSLFLSRSFNFAPAAERQPRAAIGGVLKLWEPLSKVAE